MKRLLGSVVLVVVLAGCGGGGGGGSSASAPPVVVPPAPEATSSPYAQQCAADNPYRADADVSPKPGSLSLEKQWIKSYMSEAYLWYDSMPTVDASALAYSGAMSALDGRAVPLPLSNYFEALKTKLTTASGKATDQFSFTYPTKKWNRLSQSGVTGGWGIEWVAYNSSSPNRLWRVALVHAQSPAAGAGIVRGDTLKTVDGVDFANGSDTTTLNAGVFPELGARHTLVFSRVGAADVDASMVATDVTIDPVPLASVLREPGGNPVGYLHFTDHIAASEAKLIAAVNTLKDAQVRDVVLDLRYNGGGYLYVASQLAYMMAGPARTADKVFEKLQFNAKRSADNAEAPELFRAQSCDLDADGNCRSAAPLPTLNLSRVFVIVTGDTCSASEAFINGLRGVDVEVHLIGNTTCGKPYGFTARDNCGVSYFPIEFRGTNAKGFGDYADGFSPASGALSNTSLPGCAATDDLDHPLGHAGERMLSTALYRVANGSCPAASAARLHTASARGNLERNPARGGLFALPLPQRPR